MSYTVSVVIPAFNAATFICRTVKSALDQTYKSLEVIVVDDGSTDPTPKIVREMAEKDPRVILVQQGNMGSAAARNSGIMRSTGRYIAFLDSDDIWHPNKIEKQVALIDRCADDVGLVYTWSRMIDNDDNVDGMTGTAVCVRGQAFTDLLIYNFIGNGSVALIKRECLPQPKAFDEDQLGNDDILLYLRIANRYSLECVPEFLVGYRWNTGQNKSANVGRQLSTQSSLLTKVKEIHPYINSRLLLWTRASLALSIAQVLFKKGSYLSSLKTFLPALARSPSFAFSFPFRRAVYLLFRWLFTGRHLSRRKFENFFAYDPTENVGGYWL